MNGRGPLKKAPKKANIIRGTEKRSEMTSLVWTQTISHSQGTTAKAPQPRHHSRGTTAEGLATSVLFDPDTANSLESLLLTVQQLKIDRTATAKLKER
jgi:hypothetical protein